MKLKYAVLPAAVAMLFSAASMADPAGSSTGQIFFKGSIEAPTCKVNGDKGPISVNLGKHQTGEFPQPGTEVKGQQNLVLQLTNCTGTMADLNIRADRAINDYKFALDGNGAQGIDLVLKKLDGNKLNISGNHWERENIVDKKATFTFQPYMVSNTPNVTAGDINASATYHIFYH